MVNLVVLKWKNIFFCHDHSVVDVVAINIFFMKPTVTNFFHDHGVVNVVLKWNFVSFWHDHDAVNVVENYKNIFFCKTEGSERSSKMNNERSVQHDIQIFFPLWSHQESHVVSVVAVVLTQWYLQSTPKWHFQREDSRAEVLMLKNTT